jgi:hypothetical protein
MASPRRRRFAGIQSARTAMIAGLAALTLAACATGQRPSFDTDDPAQQATGDPAIDAVLERLDQVGLAQFTADYTMLTRLGGIESSGTVVQADNSRRSITINDVRFLEGIGTETTCNLATAECEAIINDARVSDLLLTHDFYGTSFARRLRVDAGRSLSPAQGYTETIAGQPATCADVPVSGGTKTYCAVDTGPLARYDGNDVVIELVGLAATPDESKFTTS